MNTYSLFIGFLEEVKLNVIESARVLVNGVLDVLEVSPQAVQVQVDLHQLRNRLNAVSLGVGVLQCLLILRLVLRCSLFLRRALDWLLGLPSLVTRLVSCIPGAWALQTRGLTPASIMRNNVLGSGMLRIRLVRLFLLAKNTAVIFPACSPCNAHSTTHKLWIIISSFISCSSCLCGVHLQVERVFEFLTVFLPLLLQASLDILGDCLATRTPHASCSRGCCLLLWWRSRGFAYTCRVIMNLLGYCLGASILFMKFYS